MRATASARPPARRTRPPVGGRRQAANAWTAAPRTRPQTQATPPRRSYPPAYRRPDFSSTHADAALRAFAAALSAGPSSLDAAAAWLAAGAEDDALATNAPIPLPVAAFSARLDRLASDAAAALAAAMPSYDPADPGDAAAHQAALDAVTAAVFGPPPGGGRAFRLVPGTNLSPGTVIDAPGTVEGGDAAYLHTALATRTAVPAVAAILLAAVQARLVRAGALGAAARISWDAGGPPLSLSAGLGLSLPPRPLPLPRATVAVCGPGVRRPDGSPLTTLPLAALVEANARLLRAFWPGPWASPPLLPRAASHTTGGFGPMAAGLLGLADARAASAELVAIGRAASHRLERGVFTSPGAGDGRRALAAARRGVLLAEAAGVEGGGDTAAAAAAAAASAAPRREYAVLLARSGRAGEAVAELDAFLAGTEGGPGGGRGSREEEEGRALATALLAALKPRAAAAGPPARPVTLAGVLAAPPAEPVDDEGAQIPW